MKSLRQSPHQLEIQVMLDLLKREGIQAQVLGSPGPLPGLEIYTLAVDKDDFDRAKEILDRWDAANPKPEHKPESRRGFDWINISAGALLGLALGIGGSYAYWSSSGSRQGIDHDGDGRLDETWTFSPNGLIIRTEVDRNFDGKIDYIVDYDSSGQARSCQSDEDFNGNFETVTSYERGNCKSCEVDADGDGFAERRCHFNDGVLKNIDIYDPKSRKIRRIEHFHLSAMTQADFDSDQDGRLDTRLRYTPFGDVASTEKI